VNEKAAALAAKGSFICAGRFPRPEVAAMRRMRSCPLSTAGRITASVFFAALLCLFLAGCGSSSGAGEGEETAGGTSESSGTSITNPDTGGSELKHITLERKPAAPLASQGSGGENIVLSGDLAIWQNLSSGVVHIVGEVRNSGSRVVPFIQIAFNFLNSSGRTVSTAYTYIYGTTWRLTDFGYETYTCLQPGDTGVFRYYAGIPEDDWEDVDYEITWESYSLERPKAFLNVTAIAPVLSTGEYYVDFEGSATNTGSRALVYGSVWVAVRGDTGDLFDVSRYYLDDAALGISESSAFKLYYVSYLSRSKSYYYGTGWSDEAPDEDRSLSGNSGGDLLRSLAEPYQRSLASQNLTGPESQVIEDEMVRALHNQVRELAGDTGNPQPGTGVQHPSVKWLTYSPPK
jgi:hypothetical protein